VLSFDADSAGQNAAARFYEWEKSYDLDVAVADLPEGADPGELAQKDPERLRQAIAGAKPFLGFRVGRVLDAGNLDTAEGRARTAEAALAMVAEHPDPLVRDQYAIDIASRCRLEDSLVRRILEQGARPQQRRQPVVRQRPEERQSPELEALRLSIVKADEMRALVVPDLFLDELYAATFNAIVSTANLREAIDFGGPEVGDLIQRLSVEDSEIEPIDVAGRLWQRYLERRIEDCRREARFATESSQLRTLNDEMGWFKARVAELPELDTRTTAVEGLLAWFNGAVPPT
jgi:DNA primase